MLRPTISVLCIAIICHEANRALCVTHGDTTQLPWEDAADWQKDSALKGVEYALSNPDAPESAQHDAWMEHKRTEGWKYGPVKDPEAMEHPCMVPYHELPVHQQQKDRLFKNIVLTFAEADSTE